MSEIRKVIDLIKKSYDQPIIFHLLHMHLIVLLRKNDGFFDDDWTKALILSATSNKLPNQGLEIKLIKYIKNIRPPFSSSSDKLKFMIICYYLISRPPNLINNILIFEIISNFIGISDYFDGLIIKILKKITTSDNSIYPVDRNIKISRDSLNRMIEILSKSNLSNFNQIYSLPCYLQSNISPPNISFVDIQSDLIGYKSIENIYIYIKYVTNTNFISNILPENHPDFEKALINYSSNNFEIKIDEEKNNEFLIEFILNNCLIENKEIFNRISEEFKRAKNKAKFVSEIIEYVQNLKY